MSSEIEHIEYDRDINPYPSFGKKYNGEKAIISMTSWKMRITTCPKTIFSLLKQCPGFHIVLVLSEEEFPQKEKELPENLMVFVENELIELLWVYKNYKSFKKWIFTANKYPDVPIITADDGCVYIRNYAEELYQKWLSNKDKIISYNRFNKSDVIFGGSGSGICFMPHLACFFNNIPNAVIASSHDDFYYGYIAKIHHINWVFINRIPNENNFTNFSNNDGISASLHPDRLIPKLIHILNSTFS